MLFIGFPRDYDEFKDIKILSLNHFLAGEA
jgi:hypothetical protein